MRLRRGHLLACLAAILLAFSAAAQASPVLAQPGSEPGRRGELEIALENRLMAPCCWTQTLVNHESPLASALRREIHERLQRGEAPAAIEDELAARHGERIRAVPRGKNPFGVLPVALGAAMLIAAAALVRIARTAGAGRATDSPPASAGTTPLSPEDEERLLDELDRFDAA